MIWLSARHVLSKMWQASSTSLKLLIPFWEFLTRFIVKYTTTLLLPIPFWEFPTRFIVKYTTTLFECIVLLWSRVRHQRLYRAWGTCIQCSCLKNAVVVVVVVQYMGVYGT